MRLPERLAANLRDEEWAPRMAIQAAVFLAALAVPWMAYLPFREAPQREAYQRESKRVADLAIRLQECRAAGAKREEFERERRKLAEELGKLAEILPDAAPLDEVRGVFARLADSVRMVGLEAGEPVGREFYSELPFHAEIEGAFGPLAAVTERLTRTSLILDVTDFRLARTARETYRLELSFRTFYSAPPP